MANLVDSIEKKYRDMSATELRETRSDNLKKAMRNSDSTKSSGTVYKTFYGPNGRARYSEPNRLESPQERTSREKFWNSLGKRIRKGSRIK